MGEINPNDLEASDLLFIGGGDYQVQDDSPCIDAGINVGVSFKYDLARNGRIFGPNVDMGAYEKLYNSVKEVEQEFLSIFPNPATDNYVQILSELRPFTYVLTAIDGRRVMQGQSESNLTQLEVGELQNGVYILAFKFLETEVQKKVIINHP